MEGYLETNSGRCCGIRKWKEKYCVLNGDKLIINNKSVKEKCVDLSKAQNIDIAFFNVTYKQAESDRGKAEVVGCLPKKKTKGAVVRCIVTIVLRDRDKLRLRITHAHECDKWSNEFIKYGHNKKSAKPEEVEDEDDSMDLMEQANELRRLAGLTSKKKKQVKKKKIHRQQPKTKGFKQNVPVCKSMMDVTQVQSEADVPSPSQTPKITPFGDIVEEPPLKEDMLESGKRLDPEFASDSHRTAQPQSSSRSRKTSSESENGSTESSTTVPVYSGSQSQPVWREGELGSGKSPSTRQGISDTNRVHSLYSDPTLDTPGLFPSSLFHIVAPEPSKGRSIPVVTESSRTSVYPSNPPGSRDNDPGVYFSQVTKSYKFNVPKLSNESTIPSPLPLPLPHRQMMPPAVHTHSPISPAVDSVQRPSPASMVQQDRPWRRPPPVPPKPKIKVVSQFPNPHVIQSELEKIACVWCRNNPDRMKRMNHESKDGGPMYNQRIHLYNM